MWKPVVGYEDSYEVSDNGMVRGIDRTGYDGRKIKSKLLTPCVTGHGYLTVCLRKNDITIREYIHRLVALAFIPKADGLDSVNHKDGNKMNNSVDNLEWVTYSQNNQHAYNNGLKERGSEFYNAKLTEEAVREIKRNGKNGTYQEIADKYGVTKATIRDVLTGKTWAYIA